MTDTTDMTDMNAGPEFTLLTVDNFREHLPEMDVQGNYAMAKALMAWEADLAAVRARGEIPENLPEWVLSVRQAGFLAGYLTRAAE